MQTSAVGGWRSVSGGGGRFARSAPRLSPSTSTPSRCHQLACHSKAMLNSHFAPWNLGHSPILFPILCQFQNSPLGLKQSQLDFFFSISVCSLWPSINQEKAVLDSKLEMAWHGEQNAEDGQSSVSALMYIAQPHPNPT